MAGEQNGTVNGTVMSLDGHSSIGTITVQNVGQTGFASVPCSTARRVVGAFVPNVIVLPKSFIGLIVGDKPAGIFDVKEVGLVEGAIDDN